MKFNYIVDRLEGEFAICEDENQNMLQFPLKELPAGIKEGDAIVSEDGIYSIDTIKTAERKKQLKTKMRQLFERM